MSKGDILFSVELVAMLPIGQLMPPEVEDRLVLYCADYFGSHLFLNKHLPNGPLGELVNTPFSVLRDLRAYLYIADDPISDVFCIDTIAFGRDDETNKLIMVRIFVTSPEEFHCDEIIEDDGWEEDDDED